MANQMTYKLQKDGREWIVMGTFSNGPFAAEAEAQAEADRRNGANAPKPQPKPQTVQPAPVDDKAEREHMRWCAEHGITVLPRISQADRIARRAERYNEEPPED